MGVVYRARDRHGGGPVAVKLLALTGDTPMERFRREARVLASLRHPGIVRYVDDGRTASGELFIAMEWLDGESLGARMKHDRLAVPDATAVVRRVAEALGVAHEAGIVHRDLKPANLFLRRGQLREVVVLDFGLARLAEGEPTLTRTDAVLGTPAYMAPEQASAQRDVDSRTDVFALGCVLYELLTGLSPFRAATVLGTMARVLLEDPDPVGLWARGVAPDLEALVANMLAKAPDDRPRDAAAVARALWEIESRAGPRAHASGGVAAAHALGEAERRVVSVVLTRGVERTAAELSALHRVTFVALADGSVLATFAGQNAADQADLATRVAKSVASEAPGARVVVATGMSEPGPLPSERATGGARAPLADAIDRAARLWSTPGEDALRIDPVTRRLTESRDDAATAKARRRDGFVGRARELDHLEAMYAECTSEPIARAVLVVAQPGMGKSRLGTELLSRLAERQNAPTVLVGTCDAITAGSSFAALAVAIRRAAGIGVDDPLDVARTRLVARVESLVGELDAARMAPFLGEVAGVSFPAAPGSPLQAARRDPALRGDRMRRAAEDWLGAECAARPVVLVLEDLHWGDGPTVEVIGSALRRLSERPLMVLALARPEVRQAFPRLWSERAPEEIALGPLLRSAATLLVRSRLGDDAGDAVVDEIVACGDGQPFLLDELARGAGSARGDEGGRGRTPETAIAVAHGTLDRLEADARRVLRAASAFGGPFRAEGVIELVGERGNVGGWLDELERRDVIRPAPGGAGYVFRHDLLREAAYATLTEDDRRLAHALAGRYLEATGHDDAIALARHFERGAVSERAAYWYRRSAELAFEAHDMTAVLERAGLAVLAGATGVELGRLELLQAEVYQWRGEYAPAEHHAVRATELLPEGTREWFRAASELAAAAGRLRHEDRLVRIADALVAADATLELDAARIAWARTALQFSNLMLYGRADAMLARVEAAGGAAAATDLAAGYIYSAMAYRGEEVSRVRYGEAAVRSFEAAGDERNACLESLTVGHGMLEIGGFRRWLPRLRTALATAERLGLAHAAAVATMQLGCVLRGLGELAEGEKAATRALAAFRAQGNRVLSAATLHYLALIELDRGDPGAAERSSRDALGLCGAIWWLQAPIEATLGNALLGLGKADLALVAARSAADALEKGGERTGLKGLVRLVLALALHAAGRDEEARAALAEARERLLARAANLDEDLRADFLTALPENARTLRLADEWLGPGRSAV
jgi:hypothetical protein